MKGIRYVTDEDGRRVAAQIDLETYGDLWEDLLDTLIAMQREGEETESIESVRERLRERGELND